MCRTPYKVYIYYECITQKRRPTQAGERRAPPVRAPTTGHRVRFRKGGSSGPHRTRYQPSTRGERVARVVEFVTAADG